VGSAKSSNTGKLVDIARHEGARVWLAGGADEVVRTDFSGIEVLGVTSGASTPETLFREVLSKMSRVNPDETVVHCVGAMPQPWQNGEDVLFLWGGVKCGIIDGIGGPQGHAWMFL